MKFFKHSVWMWLGITVAGCEFVHPPTMVELEEEPVVVHAVLAAGSDRVAVLLTRVGPQEELVSGRAYPFAPGIDPVSGAEVRIVAGADTVRLTEGARGFRNCFGGLTPDAGPGCYAAHVPGGIRSGVKYRLHIRLPDGTFIEGESVPPPPPVLVTPEPYATIRVPMEHSNVTGLRLGQVRVRFRAPAGTAGIGVAIGGPATAFLDGARAADVKCGIATRTTPFPADGPDSTSVSLDAFHCTQGEKAVHVRPDSVHARLYLTAYDSAFLRYQAVLRERQIGPGTAAQGVSGALGLFAGQATIERTITLVPTT